MRAGGPGGFLTFLMLFALIIPPAGASTPHLSRAEVLIEQGIYLEAAREIRAHLEIEPGDFRARLILAGIYLEIEDYDSSAEEAKKLLELRPEDPEALRVREEAVRKRREMLSERIDELEGVLEEDPGDRDARMLLAEALAETGRKEEAIAQFEAAVSMFPEDAKAVLRYSRFLAGIDRYQEAARMYRKYLGLEDRTSIRLELAGVLAWSGDFPAALDELNIILEETPRHIEARMLLADIHRWAANYEQAESIYRGILADSPGYGPAEEGIELAREAFERMTEEIVIPTKDELREKLAADPEDDESRLMLARLLSRAGRFHEAREEYAEHLRRNPDELMVRLEYATALSSLKDFSNAAGQYRMYLRERPDDMIIRFELARRLKWLGDSRGARLEFESILEADPEHAEALWELGQLAVNEGRFEDALERFGEILEIRPSHRGAVSMLSRIETSPRYLITRYRRDLEERPGDISLRMLLARMLMEAGRYFEARNELSAVLSLSPGHPEAGILYRRTNTILRRRLDEDIRLLREIIRDDPADFDAQVELAQLLQAAGRNEEALMRYEIYLGRFPDDYDVRREYARLLSWTPGRFAGARREYERLAALEPDDTELRLERARVIQRDPALLLEAEDEILSAIAMDPSNPDLRAELGRVYAIRGMYSRAVESYRAALLIEPGNETALNGITEVNRLTRPRAGIRYSRMKDSEDYRETVLGATFGFYAGYNYLVTPSFRRYNFKEDIETVSAENDEETVEEETAGAFLDSYGVSVETHVDPRTTVGAWLAYNEYSFLDNTISYGVSGEYKADSRNRLALRYAKYDAIHDVKTVRSLLAEIEIDNLSFEWEYTPPHPDDRTPFFDILRYSAYASYAFYSDANRHNLFSIWAFYPLREAPAVEAGLGYTYLRYKKDSEEYWSPASHSGPAGRLRASGSWRENWSYAFELQAAFIQATSNVQRSLTGQLYRNITPDLTAGLVLTHSEVPREEEDKYTHESVNFEINYRF